MDTIHWLITTLSQILRANHEYLQRSFSALYTMIDHDPSLKTDRGINFILFQLTLLAGNESALGKYLQAYRMNQEWIKPDPFMNQKMAEGIASLLSQMPDELKEVFDSDDREKFADLFAEYEVTNPFESSESPVDEFTRMLQSLMNRMSGNDDSPMEDCGNCANLADCELPDALKWKAEHADSFPLLPDGLGENDQDESDISDDTFQSWIDSLPDNDQDESDSPDEDD